MTLRRNEFNQLKESLVYQTKEFVNNKILLRINQGNKTEIIKDIESVEQSQLYIEFSDFQEWLIKYNFVRKMIKEALMPKIWSLTDKFTVDSNDNGPQLDNKNKASIVHKHNVYDET